MIAIQAIPCLGSLFCEQRNAGHGVCNKVIVATICSVDKYIHMLRQRHTQGLEEVSPPK